VVFVLTMGCYSIAVASFMSGWTRVAGLTNPPPIFYSDARNDPLGYVFWILTFGPIIESLILVAVFELARRAHAPVAIQIFIAALFISELHVYPWWPHGVIVLPGFCIEAASYYYWRRKSWKDAYWVVVFIHALNNVIPALSAIRYAIRTHV
jgi:hypothetical protein